MLLSISSRFVRPVGVRHAGPAETQHGDDGSGGRSFLHARVSAPGESMTSRLRVSWKRARILAGPPGGLMCRTCCERVAFQFQATWQEFGVEKGTACPLAAAGDIADNSALKNKSTEISKSQYTGLKRRSTFTLSGVTTFLSSFSVNGFALSDNLVNLAQL